jgi:penicillin-binding protein 2
LRLYEDVRALEPRLGALQAVALAVVLGLLGYFWYLQVLRARYYRELAENNRIRTVPLAAPRGPLLDRRGRVLVDNRASFNIVLHPDQFEDEDEVVTRLSAVLGIGEAQIRERLARRASFRPVTVKTDASLSDVAAIEARRLELPEASVEVIPLRSYPLAAAAAHALGRVGEVTERQLASPVFASLAPGALIGQAGVEYQYNHQLMGQDGRRRVVVNSRGVEVAEAERQPPRAGPSLTLTLDAELQRVMDEAFAGRAGSAVAIDPGTGEILAMTSLPAFDPNTFANGIEPALWNELATNEDTPLMNRVIQGQYAPGSVFKIVMTIAALEEGVITPQTTFYCPGYLSVYNTVFRCNRPGGHGVVDVRQALQHSCNVFFYQVGMRLEIERIAKWARRLGLGAPTRVDLPHEASGLVPDSAWKLRALKLPWWPGETVSVAIGQGALTVTPLQLARLAALVGNGGRLVRPHLVKALGGADLPAPQAPDVGARPATLAVVREGLVAVVNQQGTGWRARLQDYQVAGKTGSAQVVASARLQKNLGVEALRPHGWFVAFAPAEAPRIALAVLVEHGGSGAEAAAPIARRILARFFGVDGTALAAATTLATALPAGR